MIMRDQTSWIAPERVRLGLHQFALRQQMLYQRKDPLREQQEQVIAAQLSPIKIRLEELFSLLSEMANIIGESRSPAAPRKSAGENTNATRSVLKSDRRGQIEHLFSQQQQLLEAVLVEAIREIVARSGKRFLSELNLLPPAEIS